MPGNWAEGALAITICSLGVKVGVFHVDDSI